jgi:hypothetical protein
VETTIDRILWFVSAGIFSLAVASLYIQCMIASKATKSTLFCVFVIPLSVMLFIQSSYRVVPESTIVGIFGIIYILWTAVMCIAPVLVIFLPLFEKIHLINRGFIYNLTSWAMSIITGYCIWNNLSINEIIAVPAGSLWTVLFVVLVVRKWYPNFFKECLP